MDPILYHVKDDSVDFHYLGTPVFHKVGTPGVPPRLTVLS